MFSAERDRTTSHFVFCSGFFQRSAAGLLTVTSGCSSNTTDQSGGPAGNGVSSAAGGSTGSGAGSGTGSTPGSNGNGNGIDTGLGVGSPTPTDGTCNPKLVGLVRDFGPEHPDFEHYLSGLAPGIVKPQLESGVPVLADAAPGGEQAVTNAQSFAQWYDVNHPAGQTYQFDMDAGYLQKSTDAAGRTVYESSAFFPLDGKPSMQGGFRDRNDVERNFHFTFELNTTFVYNGGEVFSFSGDDDLWVFIDGKLTVDIGGIHGVESASVDLDSLNLTRGREYSLSVFHAERHVSASNFKLTTSIRFTNCGVILR